MAIVKMSKIRLVGLKDDSEKTLEFLSKYKYFHQEPVAIDQGLSYSDNAQKTEEILAVKAKLAFAIDYIKKQNLDVINIKKKNKDGKDGYLQPIKISGVPQEVEGNAVYDIVSRNEELIGIAEEIEKISFEAVELKSRARALAVEKKNYSVYSQFPFNFSIMRDTKKASVIVASNTSQKSDYSFDDINVEVQEFGETPKVVCIVCLKNDKRAVIEKLTQSGYVICPYSEDVTATEKLNAIANEEQKIIERQKELVNKVLELNDYDFSLKLLYDYYSLLCEQISADNVVAKSEYTFIIDGWTPEDKAESFKKKILKNIPNICIDVSEPSDSDLPPTYTKNNGFVSSFENITLMYTVPNYRESDPNPSMAFWYFFLFGIMTGDFVYGLFVTLACALAPKFMKMGKGLKNFIKMFFWCGISSTVWGLVFGSFAGFSLPLKEALPFFSYQTADGLHYLGWFNPMEKPIMLLGLSLVVGICQLLCGHILKFMQVLKENGIIDALCDAILPGLFLFGVLMIGSDIFVNIFKTGSIDFGAKALPEGIGSILKDVGMYSLLGSVALIFLTAGRKSKSVVGYLGGGLNGVYGLINLTADILSYARLFGLGLAGAAIAFAFNTLVETIFLKNIVMIVIGVGVSVVLHIFNLAISLLGTYVHNARLQLLEFYGKFLVGDGKLFNPMGKATKYTEIKD